ncbi:hypothetical protein ONZ45_g5182 [Pleurotus djamor]|nr:hypothetical protein ONZ45_g5182 [Pleurotus djamor]
MAAPNNGPFRGGFPPGTRQSIIAGFQGAVNGAVLPQGAAATHQHPIGHGAPQHLTLPPHQNQQPLVETPQQSRNDHSQHLYQQAFPVGGHPQHQHQHQHQQSQPQRNYGHHEHIFIISYIHPPGQHPGQYCVIAHRNCDYCHPRGLRVRIDVVANNDQPPPPYPGPPLAAAALPPRQPQQVGQPVAGPARNQDEAQRVDHNEVLEEGEVLETEEANLELGNNATAAQDNATEPGTVGGVGANRNVHYGNANVQAGNAQGSADIQRVNAAGGATHFQDEGREPAHGPQRRPRTRAPVVRPRGDQRRVIVYVFFFHRHLIEPYCSVRLAENVRTAPREGIGRG